MATVVDELIRRVYEQVLPLRAGAPADYIPELAKVDPDGFGICLATADGHVYEVGDTRVPFTIQSISKPFTYALALTDRGEHAVADKIDVEPSGEPFNEISLDPGTERPRNPMINAGAITATSLVAGDGRDARFERIRAAYSAYAGRELHVDDAVYRSESESGYRNRAIGYMLRSFGIVTGDPEDAVDLYFRQCSLSVTCHDLAVMTATLANNGVNALTRERVLPTELVERVLSVMATCGMYDAAGAWVAEVGLPAKSGVGGGVVAVLPGQLGIAVYSPRLDAHGNSVRGVEVCRALSRELELHFLHVTRAARSAIRARYPIAQSPSRMRRTRAERDLLDQLSDHGVIYELHGDLQFTGAEATVREIARGEARLEAVVIDVREIDEVSDVAATMLSSVRGELVALDCGVALVDPRGRLGHTQSSLEGPGGRVFHDLDAAIEWCEDLLLARHWSGTRPPGSIRLDQHPLLQRLTPEQRDVALTLVEHVEFERDDVLVHRGEPTAGLFLLLEGRVSSLVTDNADGRVRRVSTLSAGMTFGEIPLLLDTVALSSFVATTAGRAARLPASVYADLSARDPSLELGLVKGIAAGAYEQLDTMLRSLAHVPGGR
ncbi:glutaminase A [Rhodococcus sp. HNM0569]|uniref:glutaminase A n=1 Tax=Rhodococcus sp. HNM0569 TaxID=2716340 RepID=UPI00146D7DE8|nr:glutaminase A [Rhodococcus sp. HNM0569]NLU81362.1 glutaminase A [Rhodococcus sp. HNM0569]